MQGKYIAISGNMGAGKSTLVQFLSKNFPQVVPVFEPFDENPYLADFYRDMKKWAFHSQLFFLTRKFALNKQLETQDKTIILDRAIYEDAEIFAKNLHNYGYIEKRDYKVYQYLYKTMLKSLRPPDLMIFLSCSSQTLMKRINSRGRKLEKQISYDYIKKLDRLYKMWIAKYDLSEKLIVNTDKLNYINDFIARADLLSAIKKYI